MPHRNRKLNRLAGYDYSQDGYYFVTIVTKDRITWFGEIDCGVMEYSDIGKIAIKYWNEIPIHFPHVEIDEYIVMPNHVHGILKIDWGDDDLNNVGNNNYCVGNANEIIVGNANEIIVGNANEIIVGNADLRSLRGKLRSLQMEKYGYDRTKMELSKIIHGYKSSVTRTVRKKLNNFNFKWQKSFHDHIIRNNNEFLRIKNYIINNPRNWNGDGLNN